MLFRYVQSSYIFMKETTWPSEKKVDRRYEQAVYGGIGLDAQKCEMGTAVRDDFSCAIPSVARTVKTCEQKWHSHAAEGERRLRYHNHFREHLTTVVNAMLRFCGPASLSLWTCLENCCMCALKSRVIITPAFIRVKEKTGNNLNVCLYGDEYIKYAISVWWIFKRN